MSAEPTCGPLPPDVHRASPQRLALPPAATGSTSPWVLAAGREMRGASLKGGTAHPQRDPENKRAANCSLSDDEAQPCPLEASLLMGRSSPDHTGPLVQWGKCRSCLQELGIRLCPTPSFSKLLISQAGEGQPLSWGNLPSDRGSALRKPSSCPSVCRTCSVFRVAQTPHTCSALALESHQHLGARPATDRPPRLMSGETEAQKGRQQGQGHTGGRAGAKFTPGGKEAAGTGQTTQGAGSRALALGDQAAGRPLPHWPCRGLTRGGPEPAFLNPVWKTCSISGRPAACQAFMSPVHGSAAGSLGCTFCVSQGPGTSLKVRAGGGWKSPTTGARGTPGLS